MSVEEGSAPVANPLRPLCSVVAWKVRSIQCAGRARRHGGLVYAERDNNTNPTTGDPNRDVHEDLRYSLWAASAAHPTNAHSVERTLVAAPSGQIWSRLPA